MDNQTKKVGAIEPLVSIGMPVYNGENAIGLALESLLAQTYENFEIIISDNNSKDSTFEICQKYADADSRINVVRQTENIAAIANFNYVLNASKGEFFMWAACDDLWEPEFISSLHTSLSNDLKLELAFCFFQTITFDGSSRQRFYDLRHLVSDDRFKRALKYVWSDEKNGKANPIYGIYKRSSLVELGGFKLWADSDWGADMVFVFSVLLKGNLEIVDKTLFYKRAAKARELEGKLKSSSSLNRKQTAELKVQKASRRLDYWEGYMRVIESAGGFSATQRIALTLSIWIRSLKYRRKKYEHLLWAKFL